MRISNGYPDPLIGCTMFPENPALEDFGFGFDVAAELPASGLDDKPSLPASGLDDKPSLPASGLDDKPSLPASGLDDKPSPPPLDPNNPADAIKVRSGL